METYISQVGMSLRNAVGFLHFKELILVSATIPDQGNRKEEDRIGPTIRDLPNASEKKETTREEAGVD